MGHYKNFTVDFPERLSKLDKQLHELALAEDLDVTYLPMKLAASFLLPYERIEGSSGSSKADIFQNKKQSKRRTLELDKHFSHSSYYLNRREWFYFDIENFTIGSKNWQDYNKTELNLHVHETLRIIRNSVAHSNLFFGGVDGEEIKHIYLGERKENRQDTGRYRVICCTINELNHLVDTWIHNLKELRANSALIWQQVHDSNS